MVTDTVFRTCADAWLDTWQVTLYQTGDAVEGASLGNFLDALDGKVCMYDDSRFDAVFPDPHCNKTLPRYNSTRMPGFNSSREQCYVGPEDCGGFAATKVMSTSYAYDEHDLTAKYERRQCFEYLKLGLSGLPGCRNEMDMC